MHTDHRPNTHHNARNPDAFSRFVTTIESLKTTVRHNRVGDRPESVAEHTRRMTLLYLVLWRSGIVGGDSMKILSIILIHDIPECVEGDIPNLPEFAAAHQDKFAKEKLFAQQVFGQLESQLSEDFYELFVEFEEGKTQEARIAKALDKLERLYTHIQQDPKRRSESEKNGFAFEYGLSSIITLDNPQINALWISLLEQLEAVYHTHQISYDHEKVASIKASLTIPQNNTIGHGGSKI